MMVVDASALIELLLATSHARDLSELVRGQHLHAPALVDLEVVQALRRYVIRRQLNSDRAREAVNDLTEFEIARHDHRFLIGRIWELRENLTAYDAAYLALAEALGATLVTMDAGLAAFARRTIGVHRIGR